MKAHGVEVERPRQPSAIEVSEDLNELSNPSSYPVRVGGLIIVRLEIRNQRSLQVTIERLDATEDENRTEIIQAKFVVGADGEWYPTCTRA